MDTDYQTVLELISTLQERHSATVIALERAAEERQALRKQRNQAVDARIAIIGALGICGESWMPMTGDGPKAVRCTQVCSLPVGHKGAHGWGRNVQAATRVISGAGRVDADHQSCGSDVMIPTERDLDVDRAYRLGCIVGAAIVAWGDAMRSRSNAPRRSDRRCVRCGSVRKGSDVRRTWKP